MHAQCYLCFTEQELRDDEVVDIADGDTGVDEGDGVRVNGDPAGDEAGDTVVSLFSDELNELDLETDPKQL